MFFPHYFLLGHQEKAIIVDEVGSESISTLRQFLNQYPVVLFEIRWLDHLLTEVITKRY